MCLLFLDYNHGHNVGKTGHKYSDLPCAGDNALLWTNIVNKKVEQKCEGSEVNIRVIIQGVHDLDHAEDIEIW